MNIEATDLNLLKAFDALYRERNVTKAGARIGLAQPSMSNALSRLRGLFDDPLFLRTPRGMVPTARAEALAPKVRAALALVSDVLRPPEQFDPATARGRVRIAAGDTMAVAIGPRLAACCAKTAPGIDLQFPPLNKTTYAAELADGRIDLAVGTFADPPDRLRSAELWQDHFVCIARRGHPKLSGDQPLDLDLFTALPHVLMTLRADDRGAVDTALAALGLTRRIALTVGQFIAIPDIVAETDYIASIPHTLADRIAARSGCVVYPLPVEIPAWTTQVLWHPTSQTDPLKRYVLEQLRGCTKSPK